MSRGIQIDLEADFSILREKIDHHAALGKPLRVAYRQHPGTA